MSDTHPAPSRARRVLLAASIVLIAFNLRPLFGSLSVLLPEIMAATGLSPAGASLLTTLPVLCLGLFAFPAPALARRFGTERTLLGALLLLVMGTLLRGTGSLPLLFVASAMGGAGIAVGNVLLPGLVKRDFPRQAPLLTGCYTLAICAGAASATGLTVPLERGLLGGSWQAALALWALPAAAVVLLWAPQAWAARHRPQHAGPARPSLWRNRLAWQVTCFMGLQSALAYAAIGWLAPILRERGLEAASAGYVVAASIGIQLLTCLVTPTIATRRADQRGIGIATALLTTAASLAFLFAPLDGGLVWLWAALLGAGQGGAFALALSLIVLRSPDAATAAQLSGMAQGAGYLISISGPLLVGLLRGWTGSFDASALLFITLGALLVMSAAGAGRALLVRPALP
jgi:CP family cyanate transporter-like MFS transporter